MKARFLSLLKFQKAYHHGSLGLPKLVLDGSLSEIHMSHFTSPVLRKFLEKNRFEVVEDTLDQFYAESGPGKLKNDIIYHFCMAVKKIFDRNIYFTILAIARKKDR